MWPENSLAGPIGLLAGKGDLPVFFAQAVSSLNRRLVVIGVEGLTDRRVEEFAEKAHYVRLGDIESIAGILKKFKVKKVALAGGIPKKEIYNPGFKPDASARDFIDQNQNKGDDHLLRAFQAFLKIKCGVSILDSRSILKDLLAKKGTLSRRAPSETEWKDLRFGFGIAKGIGKMDIGQTVVVKRGVVLAIEALEGTDAAIRRGGELGRGQAVVVKVSKPNQDLRFDLPCIGPETVASRKAGNSSGLGAEAGKTLLLSGERLMREADLAGISIVGL